MIILAPLINLWKVASRSPLELIVLQIPHHCDGNDVCNITSPTHRVVFEPTLGPGVFESADVAKKTQSIFQAEGTLTNARNSKKKHEKHMVLHPWQNQHGNFKNEDLHLRYLLFQVSFSGSIGMFRGKNCWETTIVCTTFNIKSTVYLSFFTHVQDFVHALYETVWVV